MTPPLLDQRLSWLTAPSPVLCCPELDEQLWIKDDGQLHPLYGGNKVRKLEYLLWGAEGELVTVGATGSHHVLATALHGQRCGHRVHGVCFPRSWSPRAERTLRLTAQAATLHPAADIPDARRQVYALAEQGARRIAPGGSSMRGSLGYVRAGLELADQVREGLLPEPDAVYVPLGTGGTALGLCFGLRAGGLRSRVVGVRVVPRSWLTPERLARLRWELERSLGWPAGPLEIEEGCLGAGYGEPIPGLLEAMDRTASCSSLTLEGTYSGKAMTAALAGEGVRLFWNTFSQVEPEPPASAVPALPRGRWWSDR